MSGDGKVVIVTGANCGLGFAVSKSLCQQNYDVILACRSEEKGKAAVEEILKTYPNAKAKYMKLDLTDLSSIRQFVADFHETGKNLDVLINNAGLTADFKDVTRNLTKDNFELTMGTNHLGHFLLTNLLLSDLKDRASHTRDARIVVLASSLHDPNTKGSPAFRNLQPLSLDNLMLDKENSYSGAQAYRNSKLANVMFTYELARQLEGSGVTVNCLCPGFIPDTEFARHSSAATRFMIQKALKPLFWLMNTTRTVEQGSEAIIDLATNGNLKGVTGKYFQDKKESKSSAESHVDEFQKGLWSLSAQLCQLEGSDSSAINPAVTVEPSSNQTEEIAANSDM